MCKLYLYKYIYIYMYENVQRWKAQGFQRMGLFIELFANVKYFSFLAFIKAYELLNETKKDENVLKHSIFIGSILFQICAI